MALVCLWISASEFTRNEILFKSYWVDHYKSLGLVFPGSAANGVVWGLWSLCFAGLIFALGQKFSFRFAVLWSWFAGFVLMWIVIGNLGVLPFGLLYFAVPLSLFETAIAAWIIQKLN